MIDLSYVLKDIASDATMENPYEPEPVEHDESSQFGDSSTHGVGPHNGDDGTEQDCINRGASDEGDKEERDVMSEEDDRSREERDENSDDNETGTYAPVVVEESDNSEVYNPITPMPKRWTSGQGKGKGVAGSCGSARTNSKEGKF